MGEKVKDLATCKINGNRVAIEYNKGWTEGTVDIHIQSDKFRYACSDRELMELFCLAVTAKRKFDSIKSYTNKMKDGEE